MAGLVPAVHVLFSSSGTKDVDARHKAGHDGGKGLRRLELSGYPFFGPTRNVALARAMATPIRLYETLRKTERAAGLDDVGLDREPLPDLGAADEVDGHAYRHQRIGAARL